MLKREIWEIRCEDKVNRKCLTLLVAAGWSRIQRKEKLAII